ncbi:MAG: hypothetical protein JWM36_1163 [Hyphomicrobiales bacterium]|nr:hypothetical protein [Hyphomicrobiales bacterium]
MACLKRAGFCEVRNLNDVRLNNVFADLQATRSGTSYIISVKARNRLRDDGRLNESYNLIKIHPAKDRLLKSAGISVHEITSKLHEEVGAISRGYDAVPAWVTVPIDAEVSTYSCYFGIVADLGLRRSIPMKPVHCLRYEVLAEREFDARITGDLSNSLR